MFVDNFSKIFKGYKFKGIINEGGVIPNSTSFLADFYISGRAEDNNEYALSDGQDLRKLVIFQNKIIPETTICVIGDKQNVFANLEEFSNSILICSPKENNQIDFELLKCDLASKIENGKKFGLYLSDDLHIDGVPRNEIYENLKRAISVKGHGADGKLVTYPYAFIYKNGKDNEFSYIGFNDGYIYNCKCHINAKEDKSDNTLYQVKRNKPNPTNHPILSLVRGEIEICTSEQKNKNIQSIRYNDVPFDEFLHMWDCYQNVELNIVQERINETDNLIYSKHNRSAEGLDVFYAERGCPDFLSGDICEIIDTKPSMRGTFVKRNGKYFYFYFSNEDVIPKSGTISLSLQGTKQQKRRREKAKEIINQKDLVRQLIFNGNYTEEKTQGKIQAPSGFDEVSDEGKTRKVLFTSEQKEAIERAVNTPNYAIIQGPPGTGKTTVICEIIRSLRKRFGNEIKILLTSTQNVAVDNMCDKIDLELPPYRVQSKRVKKSDETDSYMAWAENVEEKIQQKLESKFANLREAQIIDGWLGLTQDKKMLLSKIKEDLPLISEDRSADIKAFILRLESSERASNSVFPELKTLIESYMNCKDEDKKQLKLKHIKACFQLHEDELPPPLVTTVLKEENQINLEEKLNEILNANVYSEDNIDLIGELKRIKSGSSIKNEDLISAKQFWQQLSNASNVQKIAQKYAPTVAATCQMSGGKQVSSTLYNYVIIDESARSNPLDLMIPLSIGRHAILIGDQKQLSQMIDPEIWSKVKTQMEKEGRNIPFEEYRKSLFERMFDNFKKIDEEKHNGVKRTITLFTQYRMHSDICKIVSDCFYDGNLKTADGIDLKRGHDCFGGKHLVWLDAKKTKEDRDSSHSFSRIEEVDIIKNKIFEVRKDQSISSIGIITFYKKQADFLNAAIESLQSQMDIECGTVDAFQGKEFDCVFLSCVRSNAVHEVGFLKNLQRQCVAFSRARKLLVVVGDADTIASSQIDKNTERETNAFKLLLDACKDHGCYEN